MRKRIALALLVLAACAASLSAAFRKEDVKVQQLSNGLKVLLVEDHNIPNIALYTFFRVGSRNERTGLTGVSHFCEHMMFNGTAKVGPGEFDRRMEFRGGSNNAYTADDMTVYTDWFPAAALEAMIEMEADRMQGLAFVPDVLESERGVVASERRMSVDNNNDGILNESVRATAIMAHPYHWDVIGWMSDILSWRRDEIMAYYHTYYAPNNAVLVIVGDLDPAKTFELVKKYYEPVKASPPPPPVATTEPPQLGPKTVLIRKEAQAPSYMAVWHAPNAKDVDFLPLSILAKPLLEGESSRLYRRLVREEQLAIQVGGGAQETIDPFLFTIEVKPRPGADLDRIDRIDRGGADQDQGRGDHAEGIREGHERRPQRFLHGPPDDLRQGQPARDLRAPLRRFRQALHDHGRLRGRQGRTGQGGRAEVFHRNEQDRRKARSRGRCEVKKIAPKTTAVILAAVLVSAAALRAADQLPAPEKIGLKNGLTVYYLRNSSLPVISFRMIVRGAGAAFEPAGAEGVAGLTAALMTKGAAGMDADAVAEALDFMGASLDALASEEYAQVIGDSLSQHFPRLLEIAADCLTAPAFKDEEFAKERARRVDSLKAAKDNPGAAVRYYFQKAYFGAHPLGHLAAGTESSLKKMTAGDVKSFYAAHFRPDRAVAAVVGDIDKPALVALLESTLGRWANPAGRGALRRPARSPQAEGREARPRRQARRHPGLFRPRRARVRHGRPDHAGGLGHEHPLGRPVHVLAQHRAPHQAGPDLRRFERVPDLGRRGGLSGRLLHEERQDRRDARHHLRPARQGRPGRASPPRRWRAPGTTSRANSRRRSRPTPARPRRTSAWPISGSASIITTSTWYRSARSRPTALSARRRPSCRRAITCSSSWARRPISGPSSRSTGPGRRRRSRTRISRPGTGLKGRRRPGGADAFALRSSRA